MRSVPVILIALSCGGGSLTAQNLRLDVVDTFSAGAPKRYQINRAFICPDGTSIVTTSQGDLTVRAADGAIRVDQKGVSELQGATSATCDDKGYLYVSGSGGSVRVYQISGSELILKNAIRTQGQRARLLVVNQRLFVLGYARVGTSYVFLRQFSLPKGDFLGTLQTGLPARVGKTVNQLALNGSLVWHPIRHQVIYIPANPLEFWCFDEEGNFVGKVRPTQTHLIEADPVQMAGEADRVTWTAADWAFNTVALPDGRLVVQVRNGRSHARSPGETTSHLEVFDSNLQMIADNLTSDVDGPLIGADSAAHLYFAQFVAGMGVKFSKYRMTP